MADNNNESVAPVEPVRSFSPVWIFFDPPLLLLEDTFKVYLFLRLHTPSPIPHHIGHGVSITSQRRPDGHSYRRLAGHFVWDRCSPVSHRSTTFIQQRPQRQFWLGHWGKYRRRLWWHRQHHETWCH